MTTIGRAIAGPEYALLDKAFTQAHDRALVKPEVTEITERMLVTFGARDSADRTTLALNALARLAPKPRVTVFIGGAAAHRAKVETAPADIAGAV
jgi:spore coat polysaccharide biosynthesis predicted glycosyltransferase SpsG